MTLDLQRSNRNKSMVQRSTAQCVGRKSATELLSLAFSFLMQSFITSETMPMGE
jgi:hypothetical protein